MLNFKAKKLSHEEINLKAACKIANLQPLKLEHIGFASTNCFDLITILKPRNLKPETYKKANINHYPNHNIHCLNLTYFV